MTAQYRVNTYNQTEIVKDDNIPYTVIRNGIKVNILLSSIKINDLALVRSKKTPDIDILKPITKIEKLT